MEATELEDWIERALGSDRHSSIRPVYISSLRFSNNVHSSQTDPASSQEQQLLQHAQGSNSGPTLQAPEVRSTKGHQSIPGTAEESESQDLRTRARRGQGSGIFTWLSPTSSWWFNSTKDGKEEGDDDGIIVTM